jgi:hypothetical protein
VTDRLLRIFGVKVENAAQVSGVEVVLRNTGQIGWVILIAVLLGALTWWSYWRDTREWVSPWKRRVLTGLRVLLFLLLLLILLRPVLAFTIEGTIRRTLLQLIDNSASMKIADPRFEVADLKRAALANGTLDIRKGLDQTLDAKDAAALKLVTRVDLLRDVLRNDDLGLLEKLAKAYDVNTFTFGAALAEVTAAGGSPTETGTGGSPAPLTQPDPRAWVDKLDPKSQTTAIGDAIRELLTRKRGQALAGIFLATDGASNLGTQPLEAARLARSDGVPLFIYGVGITSPRDIIVANMFAQEVAFVKDELPVTVRVRGQGMRGESAKITLRLGTEVVASKDLSFTDDEEQTVALPFTPGNTGEFEVSASITPRDDEAVKNNNSVTQRLKVIDSKVKVLMVEESPRWEFRYLQAVLLRDRRLEVKCWLQEGDAAIAEGEGSPYVKAFPATKEELFKYDLVVLGDVNPKSLGEAAIAWLGEFVSKFGGSVLFIAGNKHNPAEYRGTELEKLLPVELGDAIAKAPGPERPTTLELTGLGRTSPMLKLSPKDDENAAIWKRFGKVYWVARVARAKPAAQVLLQDADATKATRFGKMPVVAQQQYGLGQVLYVGTDNTWRWRKNADERFYPILWGQVTQKLGLAHLLGGSKRTQLSVDKKSYNTGDRVAVYARLHTADFNPLKEATVEGGYTIKPLAAANAQAGPRQEVVLRAVPGQPGMYRGDFAALEAGVHRFAVKGDDITFIEFTVAEPAFELGETAMNEAMLKQMAEISGGGFFREETLAKLPGQIAAKTERVTSTVDADLWSSPIYYALLLLVASLEWYLRKKAQLK